MIKERFMNNQIKYKHEVQYNQILNDSKRQHVSKLKFWFKTIFYFN